jgi:hypothetical protein
MIQAPQNTDRIESINNRIHQRNLPNQQLGSSFDPRPSQTRHTLFPTSINENCNIKENKEYNYLTTFNPGYKAPYTGYSRTVDIENDLYRLKHFSCKDTVNNINNNWHSDMYVNNAVGKDLGKELSLQNHSHDLLFKTESYNPTNLNNTNIAQGLWNNTTRTERKQLIDK